jgi:hypothetical protein
MSAIVILKQANVAQGINNFIVLWESDQWGVWNLVAQSL